MAVAAAKRGAALSNFMDDSALLVVAQQSADVLSASSRLEAALHRDSDPDLRL